MKRNGLLVVLVAAVAWAAVAIVLATGALSGAHTPSLPSGASPSCLPAMLQHSATLEGTSVSVSPAPETDTANPDAQVSFLGVPVTEIQDVSVQGSRSGYHYGHVYGYFQGDGGSFVPDTPFDTGERVVVRAVLGAGEAGKRIGFAFRIATPYPTDSIPEFPNPPAPAADVQDFVSAPNIHPPILSVTSPDRDPGAGDVLMTTGPGPGQYGPLIYTPQGRLVWFDPLAKGISALNLSVQSYEGQRDLTWWKGRVLSLGFGEGEDVVMDSNYQTVTSVKAGNGYEADLHDFQLTPDHVAYISAYNIMRCDLSPVGGPRNGVIVDTAIQAIDVKTGLVRWEWHSLDHVGVGESHTPVPSKATPWDWFHLNSIQPQANGDLLASGRSTWAAYEIKRGSGEILWRLGGTKSSFAMGKGAEMAWQHDVRMLPDGTVTSFDDGSNPRIHYQSRGLRIALNTKLHTARLLHAYTHPSALLADSQGNMQSLGGGNAVVGWGAMPYVSELSGKGSLLYDAHLPAGLSSYRAFRFPWSGHPLQPPAVSAKVLNTGDETAVYASWNGAGEVASWRVLAGESSAELQARATMPDSGFESSIVIPDAYAYVSVQALDAAGALLASSPTVAVEKPPAPPPAG
jgi:hypothetical protein